MTKTLQGLDGLGSHQNRGSQRLRGFHRFFGAREATLGRSKEIPTIHS